MRTKRQARSAEESAKQAAAWNEANPVGTPVVYWSGLKRGPGTESVTRSEAWDLCGSPVVAVEGYAGGIALAHVEPIQGRGGAA